MNDEQLVVTSDNKKKIGFFSAILLVMGGSIGAGIFLRAKSVLQAGAGNIVWAIMIWLIAGFSVVVMALALVEVASGRNDNLGIIGWSKAFNTLYIYKGCKFFMTYIYLPFSFFFMPYYVILQFQDGFGALGVNINFGGSTAAPWFYFLIGMAITLYFLFTAGLSSRMGNIQNWIVMSVKFIPLVAVVIVGFAFAGVNGVTYNRVTLSSLFEGSSLTLFGMSPFFAFFQAMGGIFFAFDQFYGAAGIQSEMKNPEKTPAALVYGLSAMTGIYIIIAIAMTLGAKTGGFYDYGDLLGGVGHSWAFGVINIMIAIGILGILNGFSMWCTRWVEDLVKEGELQIPGKAYKYMLNSKAPVVGMLFSLILSLPLVLLFTILGAYLYKDFGGYGDSPLTNEWYYGYKIGALLSFSDLLANWTAVLAYVFIAFAIIGCIKNRKQNFIPVVKNKHTIWAGYTSVSIVLAVMLFLILDPVVSVFIAGSALAADAKNEDAQTTLISQGLLVAVFILFMGVIFGPTPIEKWNAKRIILKLRNKLANEKDLMTASEIEAAKLELELNLEVLKTFKEARLA
ncbi:APC family permease [[Mycoplasma] anseris]|uniref:APC family permease n=1 Tax=[Mycoplasma] anseris TaxID=92400 RepID=A0A2Z4NCL8_9BACT|nr:APC family permease [[Mycoplasma] anseris]AWX69290.1 APC family permease [[Mycoplasma] anseris]